MKYTPIKNFKNEIRDISRYHWINTHDPDLAEKLVRQEIKSRYGSIIGAFLIALFIRLAIELIVYWFKKHILNPEPRYQFGEPGFQD